MLGGRLNWNSYKKESKNGNTFFFIPWGVKAFIMLFYNCRGATGHFTCTTSEKVAPGKRSHPTMEWVLKPTILAIEVKEFVFKNQSVCLYILRCVVFHHLSLSVSFKISIK